MKTLQPSRYLIRLPHPESASGHWQFRVEANTLNRLQRWILRKLIGWTVTEVPTSENPLHPNRDRVG